MNAKLLSKLMRIR